MKPSQRRSWKAWAWKTCLLASAFLIGGTLVFAQVPGPAATASAPPKWPMEFMKDGVRLVIYQPQLQDWRSFRDLTADTAVSITPSGGRPVLGVVSWRATTLVDTQARLVAIRDITVDDARFPSVSAAASATMERLVRTTYPAAGMTIGLDRMLAGFRMGQLPMRTAAINTEPPSILVSTVPAILLYVDGEPIRVPIQGTGLEYVVNTNWDLLYDKSDYYLLSQRTWLEAKELAGPWKVTTRLPPGMARLPAGQDWDEVRQAIPPVATAGPAPRVVFADQPSELLLFAGKPLYKTIPNTNLGYATNTDSDVFVHSPDRQLYVLLSGRWFRAASLEGPWSHAGNELPADFSRIPPMHPKSRVLVSVPGTQAARDAVLLAQVPTTAIVNRAQAEARVKVAYAGEPRFQAIEGTVLSYAVNTQERVIRYGDLHYLCLQGVWFVSGSAQGPWKTADSVPSAIYAIPPTSPVYNVTYVTVANPTATTVESSYSGGYEGAFVLGAAVGAVIAYGTGYYYPPYYYWGPYPYPVYYPYPYTYGFRAAYIPATGTYAVGGAVYGPYGAAGRAAWYNPSTGTYGRVATVQTAYGGRTVAQAYNPWTGTYAATAQGHSAYAQWGSSVVQRGDDWARAGHVTTDQGTIARYKTSDGGAGTIISGGNGRAGVVKTSDDTIYAGKDGNVYKRDPNGGWSKYNDGNWTPVDTSDRARKTGGEDATPKGRQDRQDQGRAPADGQQRIGADDSAARARRDGTTPARGEQRPAGLAQSSSAVSPDTVRQLNQDAFARQQGAARERSFNRPALGGTARPGRRR